MSLEGTYDASAVLVTVNGVKINHDGVSVSYNADEWTTSTTIQGKKSRSKVNDDGAVITISIPQTHTAEREYLDGLAKLDRTTGTATVLIQVVDLRSGEGVVGRECWLQKRPEKGFEGELSGRSYAYEVADIVDL